MANRIFASAIFLVLLAAPVHASEMMRLCMGISSNINRDLPIYTDSLSILETTYCKSGRVPTLVYVGMILKDVNDIPIIPLRNEMIRLQRNQLCTDPDTRFLLRRFDIEFLYTDQNKRFVTRVKHTYSDCP